VHLFLMFMMFPSQNKIAFDLNTRNASHWPRAFLDAGIGATRRPNEELINKWSGLRQIEAELFFSWRSTGTCNFFAVTDSSLHCGPPAAPGHLDIWTSSKFASYFARLHALFFALAYASAPIKRLDTYGLAPTTQRSCPCPIDHTHPLPS